MEPKCLGFLTFLVIISLANSQPDPHQKILQILNTKSNGLTMFGSWIQVNLQALYDSDTQLTVFAFNDSSLSTMAFSDRQFFNSLTTEDKEDYVFTYTLQGERRIESFMDNAVLRSLNGKNLFINRRNRHNARGTTDLKSTYINGGMIVKDHIQARNGVVYVLDRVLLPVSGKKVYQWIANPDDPTVQTTLFQDLASRLFSQFYTEAISPIASKERLTFFLPSEKALRNIPELEFHNLRGQELSNYFRMHFIPDKVVYTSYVEHYESYQNGYAGIGGTNSAAKSRVLFMRQDDKVMVQSGEVTAEVIRGNITTANGVIHIIDRMFGYVYNSAREQISQDCLTFSRLLDQAPLDIQYLFTQPSGVNVFVPTDEAFQYVQNLPWINYEQNRTVRDMIIRIIVVRDGDVEVSHLSGNYDVRQRRFSRYNNEKLVIYRDRNETWVNGGNVRARIVIPDVKVTNGRLQYIDAVLGVPSMDIPTTVYYDDYLIYSYNDLKITGLLDYMKDPRYDPTMVPPRSFDSTNGQGFNNYGNSFTSTQYPGQNQYPNQYPTQYPNQGQNQNPGQNQQYHGQQNPYGQNTTTYGTCGDYNHVCRFTLLVPNGTAIYNYYMTTLGQKITSDVPRYRFVLRRHMIPNVEVSLEELPVGPQSHSYRTHSGELISIKKETDNIARVYWGGITTRVLMWDIGATNGIVHTVDTVMSDLSDLDRDIST